MERTCARGSGYRLNVAGTPRIDPVSVLALTVPVNVRPQAVVPASMNVSVWPLAVHVPVHERVVVEMRPPTLSCSKTELLNVLFALITICPDKAVLVSGGLT